MIKTTNPYSGQSIDLTEDEHKVYMQVKQDEVDENYGRMNKGREWFMKNNVDAYYKLLD